MGQWPAGSGAPGGDRDTVGPGERGPVTSTPGGRPDRANAPHVAPVATGSPWRIVAGAVVPLSDEAPGAVWRPGVVDVAGDRIAHVGPLATAPPHQGQVVTCPGVVLPGLVNAHAHSAMTILRGAGEDLPLERWLSEVIWPREARLRPDDVYWGMALGAAEMLRNGVTTSCEMYFLDHAVIDAAVDAGLRVVVTPGIVDVPGPGPAGGGWARLLDRALALHDAAQGRAGLVTVGLGPHAVYSVPVDGLRAVAEAAGQVAGPVAIHLAETRAETERVRAVHGTSGPRLLDRLGLLERPVVAAHGVWLDDDDIAVLAQRSVAVVHCPQSNAKLGSGVAPVQRLRSAGIRVALGTDGPASNDDLDPWEELRLAALLARATAADPGVIGGLDVLRMATADGAAALGVPAGVLAPGRLADLVHVRTDDARFVPVVDDGDLLAHLVWSSAGHLVHDVWVGGRHVVAEGRCRTIDEARARNEVQCRAERLAGAGPAGS